MRPPRPSFWTIEEHDDGAYTVSRGNRPVMTGLRQRSAAENVVSSHRQPGERVWHVAPDGYRTDLTKKFPDPEPQHGPTPTAGTNPDRPVWSRYKARYGRPH